jgi:hypothetical protein
MVCATLLAVLAAGCAAPSGAIDLHAATSIGYTVWGAGLDPEIEERVVALSPEHLSDADVRQVLAHAPAPRIINFNGITGFVTMASFAEYLIAMGYPAERIRNPRDGKLSYSSFVDSAQVAGTLAWYYEHDGMMPMLIGHSRGGMMVVRILHELAGGFDDPIKVWNPLQDEPEDRTTILDPLSGEERPVVGLKVGYAAALATGPLPRIVLGEWTMLPRLRVIPDSAEEFTAYSLDWDLIAGNFGSAEPYRAMGTAQVRNITLPTRAGHITLPLAKPLALDPVARAWIEEYVPGPVVPELPVLANGDPANIVHAADIWYSVKKHWCLEAQRLIRARQQMAAAQAKP